MIGQARGYLAAALRVCGTRRVVGLFFLLLAGSVLEAVALGLLVPLIGLVAGVGEPRIPLIGRPIDPDLLVVCAVAALVLRGAVQWSSAIMSVDIRTRTMDDLRLRALAGVLEADWSYLATQRRSNVLHTATVSASRAEVSLDLLIRMLVGLLLLVASAVVAIAIEPRIGIPAVCSLAVVLVVIRRNARTNARLGREWSRRTLLFSAKVTDSLSSVRLIRAHEASAQWVRMLREAAQEGRALQREHARHSAHVQALVGYSTLALALGLVLLGRSIGVGAAQLIALAFVTMRLLAAARSLLTSTQSFALQAPALEELERIVADAKSSHDVRNQEATDDTLVGAPSDQGPLLELRSVTIGYGEGPVLDGVDLVVPRAGLVAVTGPSGGGKSTLLDVALGLLSPESGEVRVDGRRLRGARAARAWRRRIGYVPQQTVLIPATVRQNIVWSAGHEVTDEDIWASLEGACVAEVIRRLPAGLETELNDLAQLSGGEQQRVAIARALVREPDLLVLDEATASLDPATERAVVANLLARGTAVLMATHRASIAEAADAVLRLGE